MAKYFKFSEMYMHTNLHAENYCVFKKTSNCQIGWLESKLTRMKGAKNRESVGMVTWKIAATSNRAAVVSGRETGKNRRNTKRSIVLSALSVAWCCAFGHVTYLAEQFIWEIGETHKKLPAAKNYYVFVYVLSMHTYLNVCICASIHTSHSLSLAPFLQSLVSYRQNTANMYNQTIFFVVAFAFALCCHYGFERLGNSIQFPSIELCAYAWQLCAVCNTYNYNKCHNFSQMN